MTISNSKARLLGVDGSMGRLYCHPAGFRQLTLPFERGWFIMRSMLPPTAPPNASFEAKYFPLHLALLTVGENMFPIGNWMVISKDPFRFLLAIGVGNHSLTLLKKYKEAALHFMPWQERERVVRAGHLSGRNVNKAQALGFRLTGARALKHTRLVEGADSIFELTLHLELMGNLSREFALMVMNVAAVHGELRPDPRQPILYLSQEDFTTLGERWTYEKSSTG
jgi:flavin reductase (DIM6/NTAB) family NADH-FMN oxidoreductase RutF